MASIMSCRRCIPSCRAGLAINLRIACEFGTRGHKRDDLTCVPLKRSMLVGSIRRILHDANVHRLSNRYSDRLSCVVIDEARRTFEEDIALVLADIELAKRLQRIEAGAPPLDAGPISAAPRPPGP